MRHWAVHPCHFVHLSYHARQGCRSFNGYQHQMTCMIKSKAAVLVAQAMVESRERSLYCRMGPRGPRPQIFSKMNKYFCERSILLTPTFGGVGSTVQFDPWQCKWYNNAAQLSYSHTLGIVECKMADMCEKPTVNLLTKLKSLHQNLHYLIKGLINRINSRPTGLGLITTTILAVAGGHSCLI